MELEGNRDTFIGVRSLTRAVLGKEPGFVTLGTAGKCGEKGKAFPEPGFDCGRKLPLCRRQLWMLTPC